MPVATVTYILVDSADQVANSSRDARVDFMAQPRGLLVVLIFAAVLAGCGGDGDSRPPLPPPIQFASTPPVGAQEGVTYTYQIAVANSSGVAATFSLTKAPAGAVLEGNQLSWTPTREQSRLANDFVVTAITTSGGQASQSWSVTPNGTVRGTYIDTLWNSSGSVNIPHDLSQAGCSWCAFAALVPQADGSLQSLPGTGNVDGTFQIPNVPAGYYWLQISSHPGELFWTKSSTYDLGRDLIGKLASPVPILFAFDLAGLEPWETGDSLSVLNPNASARVNLTSTPENGSTVLKTSESLIMPATDPAQGDRAYILQYKALLPPLTGQVIGPALYLPDLSINASGTTEVVGTLTSNPETFGLSVQRSAWVSGFSQAGPSAAVPYAFLSSVSVQALINDRAALPRIGIVRIDPTTTSVGEDWNYGILQYNDPFPLEWPRVFSIDELAVVQVPSPGSGQTISFPVAAGYQTTNIPSSPIVPLMSPVRNATVNGMSLLATNEVVSTTLTLHWSPPEGLSAFGYVGYLFVLRKSSTGTSYLEGPVATLCTGETSLAVPTAFVAHGETYVFKIQARSDVLSNMETAPFRSAYPIAYADLISGPISIK